MHRNGLKIQQSSEKIIRCFSCDQLLSSARVGIELEVVLVHVLVDLDDGSLVIATITVVRSAKHCHNLLVVLELVPSVHELMGSTDHL